MHEVEEWLEKLGLSEYAQRFAENNIDFSVLTDLNDLDLKELAPDLDKARDWREEINDDQLTRLAFVRTLIHEPSWILIDEVLDFVDAHSRALITRVLGKRLKDSAIIHIGRQLPNDDTFHTFVHLVNDTTARKLPRRKARLSTRTVASAGG